MVPIEVRKYQLFQVFLHLFEFAMGHIQNQGTKDISLSLADREDSVVVFIQFTPGHLDPVLLQKVSDSFYTTSSSHRDEFPGLVMAGMIVSRHHGELKLELKGPYLIFSVQIPTRQTSAEEPEEEDQPIDVDAFLDAS